MGTVSFHAPGLPILSADLVDAGDRNERRAKVALKKTLHDIEADAKVFAPVDTGALENSISTEIYPGGMGGEVGPTVDYGHYVEGGTSRQEPQPYMNPAADRRVPGFRQAIRDINSEIL